MNSEKLQSLILNAIEKKGISQRELAKLTGISRSTLNNILNRKIKKIGLDDLYQISIPLELNLENLLEACGFKSVIKSLNTDRYASMSYRELKQLLDKYLESEYALLDWDSKKRKHSREAKIQLFKITEKIENSQKTSEIKYEKKEIVKDIQKVIDELEFIDKKYDYSKLPRTK